MRGIASTRSAVRGIAYQYGRASLSSLSSRNGLKRPNVGVAGATGAVGIEMRKKLLERGFPMENVKVSDTWARTAELRAAPRPPPCDQSRCDRRAGAARSSSRTRRRRARRSSSAAGPSPARS